MSFEITVHRRADDALYRLPPADVGSPRFDRWVEDCQARWVYENLLGSGGTVFEWWHVPAQELELPLVGAIYRGGLRTEGPELAELDRELDQLEAFWTRVDVLAAATISESTHYPGGEKEVRLVLLRGHLQERLGYLREAISIAMACDGVVTIS